MSGGDLFINFTRLKTAQLQGISIYRHATTVHLCPYRALVQLLVVSPPSAYVLPMLQHQDFHHEMDGTGTFSQLDAMIMGIDTSDDLSGTFGSC